MSARTSPGKSRQYSFTLADDELDALHQVAEHGGKSAADFLRSCIRDKYAAAGLTPSRGKRNHAWGRRPRR